MSNELTINQALAKALVRDALYYDQGKLSSVGQDFDSFDAEAAPSIIHDPNYSIGFNFWDIWIDQCRHGFTQNFYKGIGQADWPVLARESLLT